MEPRIGSLEGAYLQVADRLNGIDRGIAAMRSEMTSGFAALRNEMTNGDASLRVEMNSADAALRGEIVALRRDMNRGFLLVMTTTLTCFVALAAAFISGWSSLVGAIAHR